MSGYKIVDFGNINIVTGTEIVISGIYEKFENNYRKAVLLSGIVFDGVEHSNAFITVLVSDSNFVFSVYGKNVTVTSDDKISIE